MEQNVEGNTPEASHLASSLTVNSPVFRDITVVINASLGGAAIPLGELLSLKPGSVVHLDVKVTDLIELRVNGSLIARGELVAVDDRFGVRIAEIAAP